MRRQAIRAVDARTAIAHGVAERGRVPFARRHEATGRGDAAFHSVGETVERTRLPWPVFIFIASLLLPWIFHIGPLWMSPYRTVLLITIVPCFIMWASGKAGPIRTADIALMLFCGWCTLSIVIIHGVSYATQSAGNLIVETMGAYLLGRCFIRSADDFHNVIRMIFLCVLILFPFAIFETLTGRNIFLTMFSSVLPSFPDVYMPPRWGMRRVQAGFNHPILFGVFTGSILALTHLVLGYRRPLLARWSMTGVVLITSLISWSSGPITGLMAQLMLLGWGWFLSKLKVKWCGLIGLVLTMFMAAELFANRSLPVIFIDYFAFDEQSAYIRILIWRFGTESIMNHPFIGVGFGEWDRPSWMPPSIDMHWIIDTVRHGIPAGFFLMLGVFSVLVPVGLKRGLDDRTNAYRTAFLIGMTGFYLTGWTVYFWNAVYVLFLFLLASGVWILDAKDRAQMAGSSQRTRGHPLKGVIGQPA